ncbi:MAG: hypothetical protein D3910_02195, partial [Candidatus Electrothrix sp. ATG2]|nr:hypothetical protein [Candidatus Electrothrix sp. ATG2]
QSYYNKEATECFKMLFRRNAVNFGTHCAAEVISCHDSSEMLQARFRNLFFKTDALPGRKELVSLLTDTYPESCSIAAGKQRSLLIVGSPKIKAPSTSAVLGGYLLKRLSRHGWHTEMLTLNDMLLDEKGQNVLCSAVEHSDIILLSFPLYCDTLPFLVTKAFEVIASRQPSAGSEKTKRILAIVNNGFPESYQNSVALAICKHFTVECGMIWSGGLAMGAGEGLLSGHSPTSFTGLMGLKRPPLYYINRALNITASALAAGHPVPEKAMKLLTKKPIPFISFNMWCRLYVKVGKRVWEKEGAKNGLTRTAMFEKVHD